ncbi:MAG: hypothetical protein JXQ75_03635 [Phycisphaerae bacterium]|nr:hypothetical protein [Phycisphaerae bacterium]
MRRSWWRSSICIFLALVLALALPGPAGLAFASDDGVDAGFAGGASSDDDDNYGEEIMLGVFVAVVLVLFYLGFKADRDFRAEAASKVKLAEGRGADVVVDFGCLPEDEALTSEPSAQLAGRLGLEFRF